MPLDRFIDTHGLHDVVKPHYGIDQADGAALDAIMASDFDGPLTS